mmetsp:Transcript_7125/g.20862  ORF Transcript_7125/g.20862 Transcript_7125/m.20862 type:complete len:210 (-) Transcript_7125:340-969(-)
MSTATLPNGSPASGPSSPTASPGGKIGGGYHGRSIPSSRVRSVVAAILSIYTVPLPHGADLGDVIGQHYSDLATFTDPLVRVASPTHITAQFNALSLLLRKSAIELHSYRVMGGGQGVSMDTTMIFFLRLLPDFFALRLRVSTELLLDSSGKILSHTDHWSLASIIESVPFVNLVYQIFRGCFGLISTYVVILIRMLQPVEAPRVAKRV